MSYYPIRMDQYNKILLLSAIELSLFEKELQEYSQIYLSEIKNLTFKLFPLPDSISCIQNVVVQCSENISFYTFHNLVIWLNHYNSLGLMLHKEHSDESYYCLIDSNIPAGDTLTGRFGTNESFSIYTPESYIDFGNIKKILKPDHDTSNLSDLLAEFNKNQFSFDTVDDFNSVIVSL